MDARSGGAQLGEGKGVGGIGNLITIIWVWMRTWKWNQLVPLAGSSRRSVEMPTGCINDTPALPPQRPLSVA